MKNTALLALLALLSLASCNKDTRMTSAELEALQGRLNADPEVKKLNTAFSKHCRLLATFTPEELKALQTTVRSCGVYTSTASIPELEKCLAGNQFRETYIEAEKHLREYETGLESVQKRYSELSRFSIKERRLLITRPDQDLPDHILSDFQSRKKS
ncbi:MAG: hypothetical protein JNJ90_20425 [Saprospiraceae bacterium]|jgi:hypothetical protein|nr:hypothetical protein [Saprospiraceae bacterium]